MLELIFFCYIRWHLLCLLRMRVQSMLIYLTKFADMNGYGLVEWKEMHDRKFLWYWVANSIHFLLFPKIKYFAFFFYPIFHAKGPTRIQLTWYVQWSHEYSSSFRNNKTKKTKKEKNWNGKLIAFAMSVLINNSWWYNGEWCMKLDEKHRI